MEERRVTITCNAQKLGEVLQKLKLSDKFKDTEMEVTLNMLDRKENYETLVRSGVDWALGEPEDKNPMPSENKEGDKNSYPEFGSLNVKNSIDILSFLIQFTMIKPNDARIPPEVLRQIITRALEGYETHYSQAGELLKSLPKGIRIALRSNIEAITYPRHHLFQCLLHLSGDMTPNNSLETFVKFYK